MRVQHQEQSVEDRRREPRHEGLIDSAIIHFRGERHSVPVLNISTRGAMIESRLEPRLGETVVIEFPECSRIHAFARWVRDGRIGLNFGHEMVLGKARARSLVVMPNLFQHPVRRPPRGWRPGP